MAAVTCFEVWVETAAVRQTTTLKHFVVTQAAFRNRNSYRIEFLCDYFLIINGSGFS